MSFAVFGPMPDTRRNGASSSAETASAICATLRVGQHAERRLRSDARDAEQLGEDDQLVSALEAEERQGVLADDQVRVQVHVVADIGRGGDVRGDCDGQPDSPDLDDDRVRVDVGGRDRAAKRS